MYYSPWYVNFGQIFQFSETHPNVDFGSEENSAKVSVKDFASFWIASGFSNMPKINSDPCTIVHGTLILVRFFIFPKLPQMLTGVMRNTRLKFQ